MIHRPKCKWMVILALEKLHCVSVHFPPPSSRFVSNTHESENNNFKKSGNVFLILCVCSEQFWLSGEKRTKRASATNLPEASCLLGKHLNANSTSVDFSRRERSHNLTHTPPVLLMSGNLGVVLFPTAIFMFC